jgi:DNA modification methylase
MIEAKQIEMVPLSEIKLNPKNRNKHPPEQIDRLCEIITYQGFRRPVTISNLSGFLSCGEGRYLAAQKLKMTHVPAMRQDYASEEQEYADGIADNAIDKWAELDKGLILQDVLNYGPDFNLDMLGMKDFMLPEDFAPGSDEDDVPDNVEPRTKLGDIYQLGRHKLICGDATSLNDLDKLMAGEQADAVWTDPPYNVNYEGGTGLKIKNDDMTADQFYQLLHDAFSNMLVHTKGGGAIYIAHADTEGMNFRKAMVDSGWLLKQCLVWVKHSLVMGRQDYHWKHEPILYGWAPGASHNWFADRTQTTVLEFNKPARNGEHPTMKPVELIEYCLGNSCAPKGLVLDSFGGSGSTLIACEKSGRAARLVEIDPKYCDVIVARWEKYSGQKAELINGNA